MRRVLITTKTCTTKRLPQLPGLKACAIVGIHEGSEFDDPPRLRKCCGVLAMNCHAHACTPRSRRQTYRKYLSLGFASGSMTKLVTLKSSNSNGEIEQFTNISNLMVH